MKAAIVAILCAALLAYAQECSNPQPTRGIDGTYFWQDGDCSVQQAWCTYRGATVVDQTCTKCRIGDYGQVGGGSCNCDPRTNYCKQGGNDAGSCRPYTRLDKQCISNQDCRTETNVITTINPVIQTEMKGDESMHCVNGFCKPCDPNVWRDIVGTPGVATIKCAGYSESVSNQLGRYVTETARPGFEYTCTLTGNIIVVNDTIDYNYGYDSGDWTTWTPATSSSSSSSGTATSGASTTGDATSSVGWTLVVPAGSVVLLSLIAILAHPQ